MQVKTDGLNASAIARLIPNFQPEFAYTFQTFKPKNAQIWELLAV
jgi:hypothetical protein